MLQRPFYRKISPSVTVVGAVCDRPQATAGRPYGFFCEFFAILQQALSESGTKVVCYAMIDHGSGISATKRNHPSS